MVDDADTDGGRGRPAGDAAALRAGYEQLRERVLAGRPDGFKLGHAALVRGGVAGWIAASAAVPATPAPAQLSTPAGCPATLPAAEIVAVLCEMALAHAA